MSEAQVDISENVITIVDISENVITIVDISTNVIEETIIDISTNAAIKQEMKEIKREELIKLIMRQTDYDREKILERLKFWNYNSLHVIKEYLNPDFFKKKEEKNLSLNQRMMGEIRHFCERGQRIYDFKKKLSERATNKKLTKKNYEK
jgi:hypothetical protein